MSFRKVNLNTKHKRVGDCVIRAISAALNQPWEQTYIDVCLKGLEMRDMPSANAVWGAYLHDRGFTRKLVPEDGEYTVEDFCNDHPQGIYILAIGGHVVCAIDGDWLDSWDSANEIPVYYWSRQGG